MTIENQLTISIATKDRPQVLEETLRKIHAFGLGDCPLIVCDDGSQPPLVLPALALFPMGRLIRNEQAQGQAGSRNRIARECITPYLLQLDDDSYPVEGDLEQLIDFAILHPSCLGIAIPFEEPARGRGFPTGIHKNIAIQVKAFVGCGVLLNMSNFLKTTGYAEWIGGMVEEEELCIRALDRGFPMLSIDLLRIRHEVTDVNRSVGRITRLSIRNWSLLWWIHAPWAMLPWRLFRLTAIACVISIRQRSAAALIGLSEAVGFLSRELLTRKPVSWACYRKFRRLPHALDFFAQRQIPPAKPDSL